MGHGERALAVSITANPQEPQSYKTRPPLRSADRRPRRALPPAFLATYQNIVMDGCGDAILVVGESQGPVWPVQLRAVISHENR